MKFKLGIEGTETYAEFEIPDSAIGDLPDWRKNAYIWDRWVQHAFAAIVRHDADDH